MELSDRVWKCEQDIASILDRLGTVENKSAGAWRTIAEVNSDVKTLRAEIGSVKKDVETLRDRFGKMEIDMKENKSTMASMLKLMRIMMVVLVFVAAISIGFFAYIWKHDAELAKSILALGSTVSKVVHI